MLTHYTFALFACLILFPLQELPAEKLLFEDRFEREESQERTEEIGGKWKTNSNSRADGNKQVDLKDGFIHVMRHPKADHAVSIVHPANYTNCRVEIRFKINDKKDDLGIDFADMKCKDVHAGHICKVFFRPNEVEIVDFKNGRMKKTYRDRLASGQVSAEEKQALKQWQHKANFETKLGQWHDAVVLMTDTLIQVTIDGELVAEFDSPGIGHANKDMIRFSARREVSLDDVAVYAFDVDESLPKTSKPVKHLFVAKLLLRKFEQVGISDEQQVSFDELSMRHSQTVAEIRDNAGITKADIKRRDEVYASLKEVTPQGNQRWIALQQKAGFTDEQREAFRETFELNKQFRVEALSILTKEQRKQLTKGKLE